MANISLTNKCNSNCSYCFGRILKPTETAGNIFMNSDLFKQSLDLIESSGIRQARLLGGEPTLHPDFPLFIDEILARKLQIILFTNGLMSKSVLHLLEQLSPDKLTVIMNVSLEKDSDDEIQNLQEETLNRLNQRIILGFNIQNRSQVFFHLIDKILKYNLRKQVRLGITHPADGGLNSNLNPKFYLTVGENIFNFSKAACSNNITIDFDCGFVPCMFPEEIFQNIGMNFKDISQRCNPIPDILPDGNIISCYPLAKIAKFRLTAQSNINHLRQQFSDQLLPYKKIGIFPECSSCKLFINEDCLGGCKAAALLRLRRGKSVLEEPFLNKNNFSSDVKSTHKSIKIVSTNRNSNTIAEKKNIKWVIPYIDQPFNFWKTIIKKYPDRLFEVYFPLPDHIVGSGRPAQSAKHLYEFLSDNSFKKNVIINPLVIKPPVQELAVNIIDKVRDLDRKYGIDGITLANITLAKKIKEEFPAIPLTASVLMDIASPGQIIQLEKLFDTLVPASRIVRDIQKLKILKECFDGTIRLIPNEGCLPGCIYRTQHFYEMGIKDNPDPQSLCEQILSNQPWLRLTGAWILPQHLHLYDGLYDELKLAGRVTLSDPKRYLHVLDCYLNRITLYPDEIGGGPASLDKHLEITENFYTETLTCSKKCNDCIVCHNFWVQAQPK
jgi:MoaA/NifB/PqqE/SkfB family radical SAM enzyme